jgi:hypothetical protein
MAVILASLRACMTALGIEAAAVGNGRERHGKKEQG